MSELESEIIEYGKHIFQLVGEEQPSVFRKQFWSGKVMEWSMDNPDFKQDLFRLVDVLPSLPSDASIVEHVKHYLGDAGIEKILPVGNKLVQWGLNARSSSIRGKILAAVVKKGVREMASQFIAGETPRHAIKELKRLRKDSMAFTVDLLGEYSVSEIEAQAYLDRYLECLDELGSAWKSWSPIVKDHPGEASPLCISVKLSALYSQCDSLNFEKSVEVLSERLSLIAQKARIHNAQLYLDAEDVGHNEIILETFQRVFGSPQFQDVPYPGIVVQAYAHSALSFIQRLIAFAQLRGSPIAIRLVKGAYWDYETVIAQQNGWKSPLFSKKYQTDANFEKLSRLLLDNTQFVLPAFGSHNIRSLSHAICYARYKKIDFTKFEVQTLYGMAEPIAKAFSQEGYLTRVYVPVGPLIPGMGYLVRRLLENTSNESFLRHTFFDETEIESLLRFPGPL
jgi:RHH-type transcriptional regulator, proline utilization regulon repressor / proline dehydrogenase / delta 1-pyrroline-5-carboxylate dehydrogenase